ncbi:PadR family transcriptional regulator [Candidatus Micrarchaeota archaeon]|nr:PadR family transcriptional regulator [Candidatus Micrarchaeota archaeon]
MEESVGSVSKLGVLMLLRRRPMHGYELMGELEKLTGRKASPGMLYPFLHSLIRTRHVSVKATGSRDKKVYKLTPAGTRLVARSLAQFGGFIDAAIEPSLSACAHCGCRIMGGAFEKKVGGKATKFCCKYCAASQ